MTIDKYGAPPSLLGSKTYAEIKSDSIANFINYYNDWRTANAEAFPDAPVWDTQKLEAHPLAVAIEAGAYGERLLRELIDEAARKALLMEYATGAELHLHGIPYDVFPLENESDGHFKKRLALKIQGRSLGLPDEYWQFIGMTADVRVDDIATTYLSTGRLELAVLSKEAGGIPDQSLLDVVTAFFEQEGRKPDHVTLEVVSAILIDVDISARVWLQRDAPATVYDDLDAALREAWAKEQGLGRDLVGSFVISALQIPGVHKVELIGFEDKICQKNRAIAIRSLAIQRMGFGW